MKENEVEANVFVYHREWGVGRIIAIEADGQSVLVQFRNRPEHRMSREIALRSLDKLPNDGLEATLWINPEAAYSWVRNGPLRLVAATLADARGAGKPKDLQTRLQQRVLRDVNWSTWWKRIQPLVKQSPYFQVKNGSYTLVGNASDIPEEMPPTPSRRVTPGGQRPKIRKSASSREWIEWLLGPLDIGPPGNVPAQVVLDILDVLPDGMLEGASQRLLSGLRVVLQSKRIPSTQALTTWVEAITRLSSRWDESALSGSMQTLPRNLAEFTVELLGQSRHKVLATKFLPLLISIVQKSDGAAQEVVRGLIASSQARSGASLELLHRLTDVLPETTRRLLLKKVVREVFQVGASEHQHLMLQAVNEKDHDYLLEYLALLAVDGQISADRVVEAFLGEWPARQKANRPASLKSLLIVAILLDAAAEPLHLQMIDEFRSALREQDQTLAAPIVAKLVGVAREEILQTRRELEERMSREVETLNTQLSEAQKEIGMVRRCAGDLQIEIAQRREESQLEIRRDMLLSIGEVLQIVSKKDKKLVDLISDVQAGLSLALRAGGAEILGRVGQVVSYDPKLHQSDKNLDQGASVIITAPGVRIDTGRLGDLVLLKACVAEREQENQ